MVVTNNLTSVYLITYYIITELHTYQNIYQYDDQIKLSLID